MASLVTRLPQVLPSGNSQVCRMMTSAPFGRIFFCEMSIVTGSAFSTGVRCQPPGPKLFAPPTITKPTPRSCTATRSPSICTASTASAGTLTNRMQS